MKRALFLLVLLLTVGSGWAQPRKPRPDAFPPEPVGAGWKAKSMATTVEQMASWDRYPTYTTYVAMMQRWAEDYPALCRLDTIGTSINGRLILSLEMAGDLSDPTLPEFFYSSTIHGDELTGYVMMLRLIDTLLHGYGSNPQYTGLLNTTRICINPLANPDGTYFYGNNTVQGAIRYNARFVDLNRNYPDPFVATKAALQPENEAMIAYVSRHRFRLSANLHGGSEVMNYPWDSFTSADNPHPASDWWQEVCRRFVDTSRVFADGHFRDVNDEGFVAGGDWYIIPGGRQDYMNFYHDCLEMTMEVSTRKDLNTGDLPEYWRFLHHSLVNYIAEIHRLPGEPGSIAQGPADGHVLRVAPNPAAGRVRVSGLVPGERVVLCDLVGRAVLAFQAAAAEHEVDLRSLPAGLYLLRASSGTVRVAKRQ